MLNKDLAQTPQRGRESTDPVPKRADFSATQATRFFVLKCRSSCGLLGAARWPWEALGAIFVEQGFGSNPRTAQEVHGFGP